MKKEFDELHKENYLLDHMKYGKIPESGDLHRDAKDLLNRSKQYNDEFRFGTITTSWEPNKGVLKVNGLMTYRLSDINPPTRTPVHGQPRFETCAQIYTLDTKRAIDHRNERNLTKHPSNRLRVNNF